ncbi:Atrnl1 [Symbiodinium sp. CCMP2592]|nr:Atrnl1 [Symbiodinium sp. CCMP2592]
MLMCCGEGEVDMYIPFTDAWDDTYNDMWSYIAGFGWLETVQSGSFTQRQATAAALGTGQETTTCLQYSPILRPATASASMMFQERRTAAGQCGIRQLGTSLFGGWDAEAGGYSDELWRMDAAEGADWTHLCRPLWPPALQRHTLVFDEVSQGIFLFGGQRSGTPSYSSNLYFYSVSLNTWTLKSYISAPPGRHMHTAVLDAANRRMYIFGGGTRSPSSSTTNSLLSDLFRYDLASDSWTQLTGHTTTRAKHAAVWDTSLDIMIVFGGEADDKTKLGDVLHYDPTISGSTPAARVEPVAVWDATSNAMLMCCGEGDVDVYIPFTDSSTSAYNDLWGYVRGSGWTELVQSGSFTQRYAAAAAWDAATRSLASNSFSEYDFPGAQDCGAVVWNPTAGGFFLFGGWNKEAGSYSDELWRMDAEEGVYTWTQLSSLWPPALERHTLVWDEATWQQSPGKRLLCVVATVVETSTAEALTKFWDQVQAGCDHFPKNKEAHTHRIEDRSIRGMCGMRGRHGLDSIVHTRLTKSDAKC